MTAALKRPAFQFYPSDWRNDLALRACTIGARGLWQELLVTMHLGTPYGHLALDGVPLTDAEAAAVCGVSEKVYRQLLAELERRKVFSRTADGVIYSRRMVRDEEVRNRRVVGGEESTRESARVTEPTRPRGGITGRLFNFLLARYNGCLWCGETSELELHRIVPGRHHGKYEPGNVLLVCRGHHQDIERGTLAVREVLAKHGVASPEELFDGFDAAAYGKEDTRDQIPSRVARRVSKQIPSTIPPSSSSSSSVSTALPPSAADAAAVPPAAAAASDVHDPEAYAARRDAIRQHFADERAQLAFDRQCRASRHPDAFLLDLEAASRERPSDGAPGLPWDVIGTVLHELCAKGKVATEHLVRSWAEPIVHPAGPRGAAAAAVVGTGTRALTDAEIEADVMRRLEAGEYLPPAYREVAHG